MKRRANGEGTVRLRKDGRWEAVLSLHDGKRRSLYARTQREILAKKSEALRALQGGATIASGRLTVGEYLTGWLPTVGSTVRPRTAARYEQIVRVHVLPHIGRLPLVKLGPQHLQRLYAARLAAGAAPMTVRHVHALLHHALKQAQRWDYVTRNVAEMVDPPQAVRHEMQTLTEVQVRTLLRGASGDRLEALYVLAVTTGMRQGEMLGLRWSDVDLDRGSIHVRRSLQRSPKGTVAFAEPKTSHSRRQVVLTGTTVSALRRHRVQQAQERLRVGPLWDDDDLVFANEIGRPLDGTNVLNRGFRPLLRRAGLPRIRFHDLRHTAATMLLQLNVHPKVVSEQLGHSQIGITLDTYSHVTPTMQRESAAILDALLAAQ